MVRSRWAMVTQAAERLRPDGYARAAVLELLCADGAPERLRPNGWTGGGELPENTG
jgi:hypothetical protein